ncbi:MAG: phosphate ABC transporter permease subunit PstC [Mycoplasmatales bacterium]
MNKRAYTEKLFKYLFFTVTMISILSLLFITIFLGVKGTAAFFSSEPHPGIGEFLFGMEWRPSQQIYGIGYMILGTTLSMLGAVLIAVPLGIISAIAVAEVLPKKIAKPIQYAIEMLAGIPSVLFGLFGLGFIVPKLAAISPLPQGTSLLAVIIVLAIMILPTITAIAISSIKAVPHTYMEASLGLGANHLQTIFKVIVPAAKRGITSGVVLGIGRAVGETMAIILVAGNVEGGSVFGVGTGELFYNGIPQFLFSGVRPLTANIALELGYAQGVHQDLLFSTGLILFIIIIVLNIIIYRIVNAKGSR